MSLVAGIDGQFDDEDIKALISMTKTKGWEVFNGWLSVWEVHVGLDSLSKKGDDHLECIGEHKAILKLKEFSTSLSRDLERLGEEE